MSALAQTRQKCVPLIATMGLKGTPESLLREEKLITEIRKTITKGGRTF